MAKPAQHNVPRKPDKTLAFEVKQNDKLLNFVMRCLEGISRNKAKSILVHQGVTVDDVTQTHVDFPLEPGQVVKISRHPQPLTAATPYYRIVYEDKWLVVVDKAPGVLSMPVGAGSLNMKHLLDFHFAETRQRCTAHVVHRLDCRTSGLMLYAKSTEIQQALTADWHATIQDRRYVALVEGVMDRPEGRVESWLKDTPEMKVVSSPTNNGGKWAATEWRVLKTGAKRTMVELHLITGRKNQIRVHMADLGYPVTGDGKYGGGAPDKTRRDDHRLCLHAFRLAFRHPVTGETLSFETPFPPLFSKLLK